MKNLYKAILIMSFAASPLLAQGLNKLVYGPLEEDGAGVLTVHNGEHIAIDMWVHPDPQNPSCITGLAHTLMSEDAIIAERDSVIINPDYDRPFWEYVWCDGPYVHDPDDPFPIPEGHTSERVVALASPYGCDSIIHILPDTGWTYFGSFLMICNDNVPTDDTYYPFSEGWVPYSNQGTVWSFESGGVIPEQDFCGLYFDEIIPCEYIPGDCNHDGVPVELADVLAMINSYRGIGQPYFICDCGLDPLRPDFSAASDPNGNCLPNELIDVVAEIGAYRGTSGVSGCPDCPGSD